MHCGNVVNMSYRNRYGLTPFFTHISFSMESGNVAISSSISNDEAEVVRVAHRVSSDDDIGSADDLMSQSKLNTSNNHPGRGS